MFYFEFIEVYEALPHEVIDSSCQCSGLEYAKSIQDAACVCVCVWVSLREQSHTPFHQLDRPDLQVYGQLKPRNFKRFVMCSLHMQFTSNNKIINNNPNINRNSKILIISIIMIILATTITIIIAELVPQ